MEAIRRALRGHWALLLVLLSFLLVLAACGTPEEEPAEEPTEAEETPPPSDEKVVGDAIIEATIGDMSTFSPILSADTSSGDVINKIFEGLLNTNEKIEWYGQLAEDWEFSEDGKDWTFYLRDGVTWSDGEPFTAEDVEFTFDAIMHPAYEGTRRSNYMYFLGFEDYQAALDQIAADFEAETITAEEAYDKKVEAYEEWRQAGAIEIVDDHTITFHLTESYAPFIADISMSIIPKHGFASVADAGKKDDPFNTTSPIGTGPYTLVKWSRDEEVVVEANPDYWGEGPYVQKWIYRVIPDQQVIKQALKTAEIDLGGIQPEDWDEMGSVEHLTLYEYPTFSYTYMGYNLNNPLFQDVNVRRALTHAIDRQVIVDELLLGHGTLCNSHGSPARWDYNPDVPVYEYDPEKATELLAEAGWEDTNGDGVLDKDGQDFKFTIQTNQGNKIREDSAVLIQDYLDDVGIQVEVSFVEWNTFVNEVLLAQNFEAAIVGWSLGVDPDAYEIWHTNGGPLNFVSLSNPRVDELLTEGRTTLDQDARKAIYSELQEILAEEQPYTFLYFANALRGLHSRFQGPIEGTPNGLIWNLNEWYVPVEDQLRNE